MERQHLKLMDMIATFVGALDERELFQSIISHASMHGSVLAAHTLSRSATR